MSNAKNNLSGEVAIINFQDINRFTDICNNLSVKNQDGIGTYKEKSIHRALKEYICLDKRQTEIKIGRYVADILFEGEIYEIQTGSFYPLCPKLKYYTESTEYPVNIVYPVIAERSVLRVDKESGEILRARRSPKRRGAGEVVKELPWISAYFPHPRIKVYVMLIRADELRFSDERRYRNREGRYDSLTLPRELLAIHCLSYADELREFLPPIPGEGLSAAEFGKLTGLSGKKLYAVLNFYCDKNVIKKVKINAKAARFFTVF